VTSKGQITIPREVRSALGLVPGSRIDFTRIGEDTYEITVVTGSVRALKGVLPSPDRRLTLDEMDQAIAGAAGAS
jgi:AbrB family looped-hinge helix DNA binding protein